MPESRPDQLVEHVIETPTSSGACLLFMRPKSHLPMNKPFAMNRLPLCPKFAMNRLPLCPKKVEISGLMRPSANQCLSVPRLSHNPHPTTYNPPNDADLSLVRHQRPFHTANPLIMTNLSLCPEKRQISGLVRHPPPCAPSLPRQKPHEPRATNYELRGSNAHFTRYRTVDTTTAWTIL